MIQGPNSFSVKEGIDEMPTPDEEKNKQDSKQEESSDAGDQQDQTPQTWDAFLKTQPETIQALYESNLAGLKSTVSATRQERDTLSKQLKELSGKLKEQPELQKQIEELTNQLQASNVRADFYAAAPTQGCKNAKAAYALAVASGLFDKKGDPDWEQIREEAPELFADQSSLQSDSGKGTGGKKSRSTPVTMNDLIRAKAKSH